MKNIEKYKDIVLANLDLSGNDSRLRIMKNGFCSGYSCEGCEERFLKWLMEEAETKGKEIMEQIEKEYRES